MTDDDHIDKSQWVNWDSENPMVKPERIAKGDIITGKQCDDCETKGRGKDGLPCKTCKGKGWFGITNAINVELDDIRFAQAQVRNIINYLWETEIITHDQNDAGHTFQAWRAQHRVSLGIQAPISAGISEASLSKMRAYGYVLLLQRISRYDQQYVEFCVDTFSTYYTQQLAIERGPKIRAALERLHQALMPIRERILAMEQLPPEELQALSEDNLKKMIAKISRCV